MLEDSSTVGHRRVGGGLFHYKEEKKKLETVFAVMIFNDRVGCVVSQR